ncbi:PKD domain-containing protein [Pedobacter metabolipauper]|nr:PKD domain-containing protein [Pedobacter metabolipauper]
MPAVFAQLTVTNVDPGPYTAGSSITALLDIGSSSCLRPSNTYELYLSNASGSFAAETRIGRYAGFYTPFVNGVIPAGTPAGTGYRIRIKSTAPALVSTESASFEIKAGSAIEAKLSSTLLSGISDEVFGICNTRDQLAFALENQSTAGTTVTATISNLMTPGTPVTIDFDTRIKSFTAGLAHYSIFVKAVAADGSVATKTYLIINNRMLNAFGTQGNNVVCLPNAVLEYNVIVAGNDGIINNYPGNTYRVNWGDGIENEYTLCDIISEGERVRHTYTRTSCGNSIISGNSRIYNAYGININVENSFCGRIGTQISTTAKVINKPKNEFVTGALKCLNGPVAFTNTSIPGQDPNTNSPGCGTNAVTYTWIVDGVIRETNKPISFVFNYQFTTAGIHTVRLESTSNAACPADPFEMTVCIQEPARPSFTLNGSNTVTICNNNTTVKPVNTSFVDAGCGTNAYSWVVTGGTVNYENGTSASSPEPEFRFIAPGIYRIRLNIITSGCGTIPSEEEIVVVNATPTAVLSADATLCNLSAYPFNDTTPGPTRTLVTGTQETLPSTYKWTVTGGNFEFIDGTADNSQYPTINFKEYAAYTITVTHTNDCGTVSDSQVLTFRESPVVNAGTYAPVCFNETIQLNGVITGTVTSAAWVGGGGTFAPSRSALNAVYTPSAAERSSGQVDLTLRAMTALAAPCNQIDGFASIQIKARINVISAATKAICSGNNLGYTIASSVEGSTFSWTATGSANAAGFTVTGSGALINDLLTNTDAVANATVTYRITPSFDGCTGEPFDLVVTIAPNPVVTAAVANAEICSSVGAGITLSSNLPGTRYLWTSATSDPSITGNTENSVTPAAVTQINDILFNNGTTSGTVTYTITPVSATGCPGTAVLVVIRVKPLARNVISADQTICTGTAPVAFSGNDPSAGGDGPYTYQWQNSVDNGNTWLDIAGANSPGFYAPVLTAGTSYRRIISNLACSGSQQNISNIISITVNPNAVAEFTFVSDAGCVPFTIDANNIKAVPYADRNGTYTWYANGVAFGTGITFPGYTIRNDNEQVVIKLVVTSSLGCTQAETEHTFVTRQNLITAYTQDKTEGCGPLTVNFTNTSTFLTNVTFLWDFGNGQTSSEVNPAPVIFDEDPTGKDKIYTITLTATSACGVSAPFSTTVLVRAKPLSVFSPNVTATCAGSAIVFTNTSPEASNTTYTFDFGDGSPLEVKNDRSSVSHSFAAVGMTRTYVVKMTARSACGESMSQYTVRISPNNIVAELVVNSPDDRGCAPHTVPFYNNTNGATRFVYDFGDGTTMTTITAPEVVNHTFTTPGVYTVTLTATNDCFTSVTTETITVLAQPEPDFSYNPEVAWPGLNIDFTNLTENGSSYVWDFGDGTTSTLENPAHRYLAEGSYRVSLTVTNLNNCTRTVVKTIVIVPEPGTVFVPNAFTPGSDNPALREFKAKGIGIKAWRMGVFDKWGELLWETTKLDDGKPVEGWDGTFKGTAMPQGVYYWKISVEFNNGIAWKGMTYNSSAPRRTGVIHLIR